MRQDYRMTGEDPEAILRAIESEDDTAQWLAALEADLAQTRRERQQAETGLGRRQLDARRVLLEAFRRAAVVAAVGPDDIRILLRSVEKVMPRGL